MTRRVLLIRHGDDPPDDRVHTFFATNGFEPVVRRPYLGQSIDGPMAGAVIYGGPFNAYDHEAHPFLREEDRLIGDCIAAGIPLLGICQGAQQIAHHLGAKVGPAPGSPTEFGYYEVAPAEHADGFLDRPLTVTQQHFHTFDIPEGAVRLAGSALFPNQAFRFGETTYAIQFHCEVTIEGFRRSQKSSGNYGRPGAQTREEQDALMTEHDAAQAAWFYGFLAQLFGKAGERTPT